MANIEHADELTPCSKHDLLQALDVALFEHELTDIKKEAVCLLAAQWALETGNGHSCHCWNLGNVKSSEGDGHDWCFFKCNELLSQQVASRLTAADPEHVKVTSAPDANGCVWTWFYPPHPGCRFRAFDTLLDGAVDQVAVMAGRFKQAWPALLSGDPVAFVHALKQQGYFTASETSYLRGVQALYTEMLKECE